MTVEEEPMRAAPSTMQISDRFRNDIDRSALAAGTAFVPPKRHSWPGQRTAGALGRRAEACIETVFICRRDGFRSRALKAFLASASERLGMVEAG